MKNAKKPVSTRRLKRILTGRERLPADTEEIIMAKDVHKPVTPGRLRRMLRGRNYIRLTAVVILAAFPLWVYLNRGSEEFAQQILVWLFIGIFFLLISGVRARRARRTVRQLHQWGELEPAIADLNGEDVYRIPRPSYSSEQIADNVLGEKFIFLFSCGRIIRYYQIARLCIHRGENKLQLVIFDTNNKPLPLAELSPKGEAGLSVCLHQLRTRYPGCPEPEDIPHEITVL